MRRSPTFLHVQRLMWLVLLPALFAASGTCAAQTRIHHCVAADGTPAFTDKPCSSINATPVDHTMDPLSPRGARGPRHCPMDIRTLGKRVAAAFRAGNANALAGLMLWGSYGEREAAHTVLRLAKLMHRPFLGLLHEDKTEHAAHAAPASSTWTPLPPLNPGEPTMPARADTITVKLADPSRPRVVFDVMHRNACLWLRPL